MGEIYKIKVTMGRITFEIESHDKNWVESKEKALMGNIFDDPASLRRLADFGEEKRETIALEPTDMSLTINEYYQKYVKPRNFSRPTIALFLVYYLEKLRKEEAVKTNDVKMAFQEIQFPKYDKINLTDILNSLKAKGYLNKPAGKWKLTITGVDYVLDKMTKE